MESLAGSSGRSAATDGFVLLGLLLLLSIGCASVPRSQVPRLGPAEAEQKVRTSQAILVCAYAEDSTCGDKMLEGAMFLSEILAEKPRLAKDQALIFYCA